MGGVGQGTLKQAAGTSPVEQGGAGSGARKSQRKYRPAFDHRSSQHAPAPPCTGSALPRDAMLREDTPKRVYDSAHDAARAQAAQSLGALQLP
jgi:hypothetical protein